MFVIFDFHQLALNGNLLHEKLSSAWYNRTVVMKKKNNNNKNPLFESFLCFAQLKFPRREKKLRKRIVSIVMVSTGRPEKTSIRVLQLAI